MPYLQYHRTAHRMISPLKCRHLKSPIPYLAADAAEPRSPNFHKLRVFATEPAIAVFADDGAPSQVAIFPDDRTAPELDCEVVQIRLRELSLHRPRQWGACWLALELWDQLALDRFWAPRLPPSRQGTRWLNVLKTLAIYRLIDLGSEWRLHRHWYRHSALGDLLGEDEGVAQSDTLYRCLDKLLAHKKPFFSYLRGRCEDLFGARFEVLLYDLTSTYFESDPPGQGKRQFGYSRDKRFDCVQVVIALIVTPEGFPIAYEVLAGNTADNTTLPDFLDRIEEQYGKAERIWVMDRGIPTEEVLARTTEDLPLPNTPNTARRPENLQEPV